MGLGYHLVCIVSLRGEVDLLVSSHNAVASPRYSYMVFCDLLYGKKTWCSRNLCEQEQTVI